MRANSKIVLVILRFLAYLAMIDYAIICGTQLTSLVVGLVKPDFVKHLYLYDVNKKLFDLRDHGIWFFISAMSVTIVIGVIKIWVCILAIQLLSKLNPRNPFSMTVAIKIETIARLLFAIWVIGVIGEIYFESLTKNTGVAMGSIGNTSEFLLIFGIVYIISQIFKRGIELQEENQLTV